MRAGTVQPRDRVRRRFRFSSPGVSQISPTLARVNVQGRRSTDPFPLAVSTVSVQRVERNVTHTLDYSFLNLFLAGINFFARRLERFSWNKASTK